MIDLTTSNEIIKQRALGLSFDAISKITHVSKPTIIEICSSRLEAIEEAKSISLAISKEEILVAINIRRVAYTNLIYRSIDEMQQRDLSQTSTGGIIKIITGIEKTLDNLEIRHAAVEEITRHKVIIEFTRGYLAQLEAEAY
jgi:hypothetical protein